MSQHPSTRRRAGNLLVGIGVIILLAATGAIAWNQLQAVQLRAQLRATPTPVAQEATHTPAVVPSTAPTVTATASAAPIPTATATHASTATALTPTPRNPSQPTPTPRPATATAAPRQATPTDPASIAPPAATTSGRAPVRIVVPFPGDLRIDASVVPMGWQVIQTANGPQSEWVIPKNEAGHHINSANLGEQGNIVISGHNNIFGQVFKPISFAWDDDTRVKVDDFTDQSDILTGRTIELYDVDGRQTDYTITAFYRLRDTGISLQQRIANARFIQPTAAAQLTLVTCWPPTSNTHRLIVIAVPTN